MSNIERRYAKLDEGVFPEEGEYGVTYLTLYSSDAGNVYDGWVYDPENKVIESETPRTYGYRNPDYPQYCWDDELVVDLSNAQARQESSDFIQGRITSFNTNVSSRPIVLQDIDITGLTEEERENLATTVLFCAIPLVQDAYIQAQVEVQCKCNLSPDNTSGEMRIEAFYILNDESDRTMRPNPVHTFTVSSPNERHTLPWLYWNPALRHEDHNYIGVKLICTGGTAEIGISDDPDYGDAMITLGSAGMTGDKIDSGRPIYLEIFGREEVVGGYELDINDYTVVCTYDTGEVYNVTNMCTFDPPMGTEITEATTVLTANYMGLYASMVLYLGLVESIELIGPEEFYDEITIDTNNYIVLAYLDNGDIMEVTSECTFNPVIGTTITETTTVIATFEPFWMSGQTFTASLEVEKVGTEIARATSGGLTYTLYQKDPDTPSYIKITGNSAYGAGAPYGGTKYSSISILPLANTLMNNSIEFYDIEWAATGPVCGVYLPAAWVSSQTSHGHGITSNMINFDKVKVVPQFASDNSLPPNRSHVDNPICLNFSYNRSITSEKISFLNNMDCGDVKTGFETVFQHIPPELGSSDINGFDGIFRGCNQLTSVDFLSNLSRFKFRSMQYVFWNCSELNDISGLKDWDTSECDSVVHMFEGCAKLENASDLYKWYLPKVQSALNMFSGSGLTTLSGLGNMHLGEHNDYAGRVSLQSMFSNCTKLKRLNGAQNLVTSHAVTLQGMFYMCEELEDISAASNWITSNVTTMQSMFAGCRKLRDISPMRNWDTSEVTNMHTMFSRCPISNDGYLNTWNVERVEDFRSMFSATREEFEEWGSSQLIWPDYYDRFYDDPSLLFGQVSNLYPDKIYVTNLRNDRWKEYDAEGREIYPYFITSAGMYSGRDVYRIRSQMIDGQSVITEFRFLNRSGLPSWYASIFQQKIYDRKTVMGGYNYDW